MALLQFCSRCIEACGQIVARESRNKPISIKHSIASNHHSIHASGFYCTWSQRHTCQFGCKKINSWNDVQSEIALDIKQTKSNSNSSNDSISQCDNILVA